MKVFNTTKNIKAQVALEYAMLVILVVSAFLATSYYIKRGIQGRWRSHVDELGEQYNPLTVVSNVTYTLESTTSTDISQNDLDIQDGVVTERHDFSFREEKKDGTIRIKNKE